MWIQNLRSSSVLRRWRSVIGRWSASKAFWQNPGIKKKKTLNLVQVYMSFSLGLKFSKRSVKSKARKQFLFLETSSYSTLLKQKIPLNSRVSSKLKWVHYNEKEKKKKKSEYCMFSWFSFNHFWKKRGFGRFLFFFFF